MIRAGIIGGAGYTAGELIRLLLAHPQARIVFVHSTSNAGNRLADVHGGLEGDIEMRLSDAYDLQAIDVLFLCSAHGESRKWMEANTVPAGVKIIDLAQDFRDESGGFVYGLPELNRDRIRTAQRVANPGCFATAIQLALLPLAAAGLLTDEVHVTAVTGSTGAGVKPSGMETFIPHESVLRYEEMKQLVDMAMDMGVEKVRLTGGEPFARKGFADFLERLRAAHPALDIRVTTNGTLIGPHIQTLKAKIGRASCRERV